MPVNDSESTEHKNHLIKDIVKEGDDYKCDGCDEKLPLGAFYITGIESCCGGCYRRLCVKCVKQAIQLILTPCKPQEDS